MLDRGAKAINSDAIKISSSNASLPRNNPQIFANDPNDNKTHDDFKLFKYVAVL